MTCKHCGTDDQTCGCIIADCGHTIGPEMGDFPPCETCGQCVQCCPHFCPECANHETACTCICMACGEEIGEACACDENP